MLDKRAEILRKITENFNYAEYIKKSKKKIVENCSE